MIAPTSPIAAYVAVEGILGTNIPYTISFPSPPIIPMLIPKHIDITIKKNTNMYSMNLMP